MQWTHLEVLCHKFHNISDLSVHKPIFTYQETNSFMTKNLTISASVKCSNYVVDFSLSLIPYKNITKFFTSGVSFQFKFLQISEIISKFHLKETKWCNWAFLIFLQKKKRINIWLTYYMNPATFPIPAVAALRAESSHTFLKNDS